MTGTSKIFVLSSVDTYYYIYIIEQYIDKIYFSWQQLLQDFRQKHMHALFMKHMLCFHISAVGDTFSPGKISFIQ